MNIKYSIRTVFEGHTFKLLEYLVALTSNQFSFIYRHQHWNQKFVADIMVIGISVKTHISVTLLVRRKLIGKFLSTTGSSLLEQNLKNQYFIDQNITIFIVANRKFTSSYLSSKYLILDTHTGYYAHGNLHATK